MAKGRFQKGGNPPEREKGEVYGFLLTIRAIAAFAVSWPEYPAQIRVLCVLAEYMNQDGECRVSRFTLADRLGMSRESVQYHLKGLRKKHYIEFKSVSGALTQFKWHWELIEEISTQRSGQYKVEEGRKLRRAERQQKRRTSAPPKAKVQNSDFASVSKNEPVAFSPSISPQVQNPDFAPLQNPDFAAGAKSRFGTGCKIQTLHEETSFRTTEESSEREGAGAPASPCGSPGAAPQKHAMFLRGDRVATPGGTGEVWEILEGGIVEVRYRTGARMTWQPERVSKIERVKHSRLGHGTVKCRDGNIVTVLFDRSGEKRVVAEYLKPVA